MTQSLAILNRDWLLSITRQDILDIYQKFKDDPKQEESVRRTLYTLFEQPECIHHFGWFINRRYVDLETPEFHKEILSIASDQSVKFSAFGAPRGHAKSTTVDFTYAMWSTCYERHHFGVIISDTVTQSIEFVNALKDELESNVIVSWLFGTIDVDQVKTEGNEDEWEDDWRDEVEGIQSGLTVQSLKGSEWRDGDFVTSTGVRWVAKGAGMKIRGLRWREHRPDLMIFDDLENDERVATPEQRKKLKNWFNKAALPALSRHGRAIIVGTILHHDSLLANILANKDMYASWVTRLYKAIMQDESGDDYALWEEHISLVDLIRMREDPTYTGYMGSLAFAQEYQNQPFDPDDAIVQPEWIQFIERDKLPSIGHMVASAIAVDPAASEKTTADPTAKIYAELYDDGNLYVRAVGNKRMSPTKAAQDLEDWNTVWEPNRIGMEEGVLGLVFNDLVKGLPMIGLKPDKDKVRRLLAVSRFFEAGHIFIVKGIKNATALYDQLVEFPSGSHDDMVDALVYVIRMLLVQGIVVADEVQEAGDYSKMGQDKDDFDDDDDDW